jgi:hypothetical protein
MKTKLISRLFAAALMLAGGQPLHAGPVGKGGFGITKPGKYTLIRNLTAKIAPGGSTPVGIVVAASDVELDLAGFTIAPGAGKEGLGIGIQIVGGVERVRVLNGRVRDFEIGLLAGSTMQPAHDGLFERLHLSRCAKRGIELHGNSHVLRACALTKMGANGIGIAVDNAGLPLCEVSDCTISSEVFGASGVATSSNTALIIRRCVVQRFFTAFSVNPSSKLLDNVTSGCTNLAAGGPMLLGVNQ